MTRPVVEKQNAWIGLLAIYTFGSFIETIFFGQLTAFTPLYLPKLGISPDSVAQWTGIVAAVTGFLGLPFLPFWGALADRFSRKPVIIRSFAVEIMAGVISLLAGNIWIFIIGRTLTSLALGNSGLMMTTLSERVPSRRQGFAFSIMNSASPVGVFLGPLIGGPVVDHWGFPTLLGIDAVLLTIVVLIMMFGYHDRYQGVSDAPILKMAGESIRTVAGSQRLRILFGALFLLFAGWMLALTYAALAIGQLYQGANQATVVGIVLGAGGILAMILGPAIGALADRYGYWRVLLIGSISTVVLWLLPAFASTITSFAITWALINGLSAGVFSLSFSVLSQSAPEQKRGRVMSFAYLPVNIGLFLGPAIGSIITRESVFAIFPAAAFLTQPGSDLVILCQKKERCCESQIGQRLMLFRARSRFAMNKKRLDVLVFENGLAESRSQAQRLVMAGQVRVDGQVLLKPSDQVQVNAHIEVENGPRFVSRGGEKLQGAIEAFHISVKEKVCADVGSSTGGFTDSLLQAGARKIYAIDVGYGILHWKLRNDPRIVVMERTNARFIQNLPEPVSLVTIDASFISLKILLPVIKNWLQPADGEVVTLIKPQFEAGRKEVNRGEGVIRDPKIHQQVVAQILEFAKSEGFLSQGVIESPLRGPKGNVEYLAYFQSGFNG